MNTTENRLMYNLEEIDSSKIITPVSLYQRATDIKRVNEIAKNFDERIANEPKVSFRDGKYFVFDGQHTLLARVKRNKGNHLPVLCKVYFDLSAEEEAKLFAAQTGISSRLKSGERLRAKAFSNDRTRFIDYCDWWHFVIVDLVVDKILYALFNVVNETK